MEWVDADHPPLRVPQIGDIVVDIARASCAPFGWVAEVANAPGPDHPPQVSFEDPSATPQSASPRLRRISHPDDRSNLLWDQNWSWRTRLLRVRYRYLASFALRDTFGLQREGWPTPELGALRAKMVRAREAAERAEHDYRNAYKAWRKLEEARLGFSMAVDPPPPPRGRRGDEAMREATRALLRLYDEAIDKRPTYTTRGPASRFVAAFFLGLDGQWFWETSDNVGWECNAAELEVAGPISAPGWPKIREMVRQAIKAEEDNLPSEEWENGAPVAPGRFSRFFDDDENWRPYEGERGEFFLLTPPE